MFKLWGKLVIISVVAIVVAFVIFAGVALFGKKGGKAPDKKVSVTQSQKKENTQEDVLDETFFNTSIYEKESDKEEKDGFDEKSNSTITVGKFDLSIPSYWEIVEIESDTYEGCTEESEEGVAVLYINSFVDEIDPVTYDFLEKEDQNGNMIKSFEACFDSCNGTTSIPYSNGVVKGFIYKTSFEMEDEDVGYYNGSAISFIFPSESDNKWIEILLEEIANPKYTYGNDFEKIINSITKSPEQKINNDI